MRRVLSLLTSRRLTAALFLIFLALFVLGLVLPQRPLLSPAAYSGAVERLPEWLARTSAWLQLGDIYGSAVMMVVYVLFTAQVLAFLGTRLVRAVREAAYPPSEALEEMPIRLQVEDDGRQVAALERLLRARHFRMSDPRSGAFTAVKNAFSPVASLVFHASFILLLGGGWMVKANQFHGDVALAEGQPFRGTAREYLGGAAAGSRLPEIGFTPEKIRPAFSTDGKTIDIACRVRLFADADEVCEIGVNRPLRVGDVAVLLMSYDLAPEITVRHRASGREVDAQCVRLSVWSPGNPRDEFHLRRPRARVSARFFPDASGGGMELRDPVLEVDIKTGLEGAPGVSGRLRPGESIAIGDYDLRLEGLRTWGVFSVSREPGTLLMIGFIMMVVGAAYRLLCPRRWVSVRVCQAEGSSVLLVGGRAELFPEGFRLDLEALLEEVRGASSPPSTASREGCHGNA